MKIEANNIYHGDCLELMQYIEDKSIDMILCDLPYGTTRNKWDSTLPLNELWKQYERIIKDKGAIALFAQPPFDKVLAHSNLKLFRYEWIWVKDQGTGFLNANRMPLKIHENILIFYKKLPTYNPQFWESKKMNTVYKSGRKSANYGDYESVTTKELNTTKRFPVDVIKFNKVNGQAKNKIHPTQKPVALCEYLIKTYTNEGQIVLDNCIGSGTTVIACLNTNRKYIGFELDKNNFNISNERIKSFSV